MNQTECRSESDDTIPMLTDAQAMLQSAAQMSGEAADAMRQEGMQLIDFILNRSRSNPSGTKANRQSLVANTRLEIRHHPWWAIAIAASAGMFIGNWIAKK